jgi:23S rRNA U2552 (ribose-2'-O)-methylase RlmE/FtsJ
MEIIKDRDRPWLNIQFYGNTNINTHINNTIFELESTQNKHYRIDDELILHDYRNKIDEYEKTLPQSKNWEYYKKVVNPYELVYTQKKYINFPESICCLKPLSRSYFKMIEILHLTNFFEKNRTNIRSAHVCEGPGGFIEALYDEVYKNNKKMEISVAMTLKSKLTNVPGWKRATTFLQKNKTINIIYGEDGTGDILKPENQQYFIDYCQNNIKPSQKMDIFTADGGFDFSFNYEKQEEMIFPLLIASTKIGFEVLKKGGVFILKIFDFYNKSTTDLIYFLSCYFEEWTLYKPATSRPCNPEHYFIGKNFIGCSEEILDILRLWCSIIENNQNLDSLYKSEYPSNFKEILHILRKNSFKTQIEYLEKVFNIIKNDNNDTINAYLQYNEIMSYEWCVKFKVPYLRVPLPFSCGVT